MRLLNAERHTETTLTFLRVADQRETGCRDPPSPSPRAAPGPTLKASCCGVTGGEGPRCGQRPSFPWDLLPAPFPPAGTGTAGAAGTLPVPVRAGSADRCFPRSAPAYQTVTVTERWSCVFNFIRRKNSDICCARFTAPVQIYSAF